MFWRLRSCAEIVFAGRKEEVRHCLSDDWERVDVCKAQGLDTTSKDGPLFRSGLHAVTSCTTVSHVLLLGTGAGD
jgi:hypothetical protein